MDGWMDGWMDKEREAQTNKRYDTQEDAGEATARPCFGVRSEKNLRQKRYKKVF